MPAKVTDPVAHLMARVVKQEDGCWIWQQHRNRHGYGTARITMLGGHVLVHRAIYELLVGPIPDGLELDHLCRVPACCNPAHLEPVTHLVNIERGEWQERKLAVRAAKTHCRNGHPYAIENTHRRPSGTRRCRACAAAYARRRRAA